MKLFYTPFDHVHAVEAVINYCELRGRIELLPISPFGDDTGPLVSANPLGTVPTVVADDGTPFFGGPVTYEYLDTLHNKRRLFPTDPDANLLVRRRLWLADALFDNAVKLVIESWEPAETIRKAYVDRTWQKVARSLDFFESEVPRFGEMDIGQLRLVTALQYLGRKLPAPFCELVEVIGETYRWQVSRDRLASWYERTHQDPIFHSYLDPAASGAG